MGCSSPSSSSPPSPSSPLPVSVGPGCHSYVFSSSRSPSPPFSPPPPSTPMFTDQNLPLLSDKYTPTVVLSPFSLEYGFADDESNYRSSCLKDLLLLLLLRCCGRCSSSFWEPHPNQLIKHY